MTDSELRVGLTQGADTFAGDLRTGRYGDPYVMVTALVYPDREPAVLVTYSGRSAYDLTHTGMRPAGEGEVKQPLPLAELSEAGYAVTDAGSALRWWRQKEGKPGDVVAQRVREHWQTRRMSAVHEELRTATARAARPAQCPHCKDWFTSRGLPMHLARARYCAQQEARTEENDDDAR